eukprot:COSAG04_NODE_814_length_10091_cov_7.591873_4_plen_243_part_00
MIKEEPKPERKDGTGEMSHDINRGKAERSQHRTHAALFPPTKPPKNLSSSRCSQECSGPQGTHGGELLAQRLHLRLGLRQRRRSLLTPAHSLAQTLRQIRILPAGSHSATTNAFFDKRFGNKERTAGRTRPLPRLPSPARRTCSSARGSWAPERRRRCCAPPATFASMPAAGQHPASGRFQNPLCSSLAAREISHARRGPRGMSSSGLGLRLGPRLRTLSPPRPDKKTKTFRCVGSHQQPRI